MAKALSDPRYLVAERGALLTPSAAIPDLEVIEVAHDHKLTLDPGVLEQRLVEDHAAGRVELRVERRPGEVAGELPALRAERIEVGQEALRPALELVGGPDRHAGLEALSENQSSREGCPDACRHVEPVLRIECVFEVPAERHSLRGPWSLG